MPSRALSTSRNTLSRDLPLDGCRQEQDHRGGDQARSEGGRSTRRSPAYQKILAEDAKDVRVLLKVGELYQKKGDETLAADAFTRVAETYAEHGFFLKAVAVYKQIVKLTPEDVRVNERLAGLYQQLGLMSDAMGQLQYMAAAYEKGGDAGKLTDVRRSCRRAERRCTG